MLSSIFDFSTLAHPAASFGMVWPWLFWRTGVFAQSVPTLWGFFSNMYVGVFDEPGLGLYFF